MRKLKRNDEAGPLERELRMAARKPVADPGSTGRISVSDLQQGSR